MKQLLEFKRKVNIILRLKEPCSCEQVQKPNYMLLLNHSTKGDLQNVRSSRQSCGIDDEPHNDKARSADLETYLRSMKGYSKEVNCDGPKVDVYSLVKKAVEGFIEHTEGGITSWPPSPGWLRLMITVHSAGPACF